MKLTEVCEKERCTACCACLCTCPLGCIEMKYDETGNLYPVIDQEKCIGCGRCQRSCQTLNKPEQDEKEPTRCYAVARKDLKDYPRCASGGIGSLIMENLLAEGFLVYATTLSKNNQAVVRLYNNEPDKERFSGSRYVQSYTGSMYAHILKALKYQRVFFIGTPCQVAGLYSYLGGDNPNLVTCDLLCHGVSSQKYLDEEIARLGIDRDSITNITFRGFEKKEDFWLCIYNDLGKQYAKYGRLNGYFKGFLDGITIRPNCHTCPYAKQKRMGDLTLGDFIGLGQNDAGLKKNQCTMLFVNSDKGNIVFDHIKNECNYIERKISEAVKGGASLQHPFEETEQSLLFREVYKTKGYEMAIKRVIAPEIRKESFNRVIRKIKSAVKK